MYGTFLCSEQKQIFKKFSFRHHNWHFINLFASLALKTQILHCSDPTIHRRPQQIVTGITKFEMMPL